QRTWSEICKQNVARLNQAAQCQCPFFTSEIQCHTALISVVGAKMRAITASTKTSEWISSCRVLDLDHISPKIRQHHACQRRSDHRGYFNDSYPCKRSLLFPWLGFIAVDTAHSATYFATSLVNNVPSVKGPFAGL